MGRPKKIQRELLTVEDCTAAMGRLLAATIEAEKVVAERDLAIAAASARFEPRLDEARQTAAEMTAALEGYYYAHVQEIEASGRKSLQLVNGVMGRRDNPPALKPLNRRWTWAAIKQAVRAGLGLEYLRQPEPELDRDKLKTLGNEKLREFGMKVESDETFYIEPERLPEVRA